jgi:hypothetical protein
MYATPPQPLANHKLETALHKRPEVSNTETASLFLAKSEDIEDGNLKLIDRVDSLLARNDLDRPLIELLLTDFGVNYDSNSTDKELKNKFRAFMVDLVEEWLPKSEQRFTAQLSGGFVGGMVGLLSPLPIIDKLTHYYKVGAPRSLPLHVQVPAGVATFSLAAALAILGYKTVKQITRQVSKYKLSDEEIYELFSHAKADELFERNPDRNIYEDLVRRCELVSACDKSNSTCQKDLHGLCKPNLRLQVMYRPYGYEDAGANLKRSHAPPPIKWHKKVRNWITDNPKLAALAAAGVIGTAAASTYAFNNSQPFPSPVQHPPSPQSSPEGLEIIFEEGVKQGILEAMMLEGERIKDPSKKFLWTDQLRKTDPILPRKPEDDIMRNWLGDLPSIRTEKGLYENIKGNTEPTQTQAALGGVIQGRKYFQEEVLPNIGKYGLHPLLYPEYHAWWTQTFK